MFIKFVANFITLQIELQILKILSSQTSSRCLAFKQVPASFLVLQWDLGGAQFKVSLEINGFKVNLGVHSLL